MKKDEFYSFLRKIPKAEIHLHAEGTISRHTVRSLMSRNPGAKVTAAEVDKLFSYNNLKEFIGSFLYIQGLLEKTSDLRILFDDVAAYLRANNIVYCELFFSPSMFLKKGFTFPGMLDTIQEAIDEIERRKDLKINLIIDVSRTFGTENAQANLEATLLHKTPMIIGVGLGGDEQKGPAKLFGEVFAVAASRGLHVVAHAGEDDGPQSIWDALQTLKVERIGHGISAIQDPELVRYLAEKQIPIEICMTSNLFTQKYVSKIQDHPVRPFYDAGVLITVNTDDPTFFNSTILDEFWLLHSKLKFSMEEIKDIILNGFRASFLSEEEKEGYLAQVEKAWKENLPPSLVP